MRRFIHYFIAGVVICSVVMLIGCKDGFQGVAYERNPDDSIGPRIPSVKITFVSESGDIVKSVNTDSGGSYRITLSSGRYYVTGTHPDYEDYFSAPGFFVVTGDGYQTGNIFLRKPRATTALILRHADRANDSLSPAGQIRAQKLAHVARKAGVTAIYATEYKRTQDTARPLADFLKLELNEYKGFEQPSIENMVSEILSTHRGDVVLVVGHAPSLRWITQAFGSTGPINVGNEFDNLFVLTHRHVTPDAPVDVVNFQYGEPSGPDSEQGSYRMKTVLLIRHKEPGAAGDTRAEKLAHVVRTAGIRKIYATDSGLSKETVQPLANEITVPVTVESDIDVIADYILSVHLPIGYPSTFVVAGERSDISGIIEKLDGKPTPIVYTDEYDSLLVVTLYKSGEAKVVSLQYGEPSP